MIEKTKVRKILNNYLKTLKTRKETTSDIADKMLKGCSTQLLQQIVRNTPDYERLRAKSQFYSEIIDDIFDLLDAFEEEN